MAAIPADRPVAAAGPDRLVLVTYSPRLPAGVLSWPAWEALRAAPVYSADADSPQARAVAAAGIAVHQLGGAAGDSGGADGESSGVTGEPGGVGDGVGAAAEPGGAGGESGGVTGEPGGVGDGAAGEDLARARAFRKLARGRTLVWLATPEQTGSESGFVRVLGRLVAAEGGGRAEIEIVYGSWDPPGARLLDVVSVMDRLRSPGGCPWDAEQTHASLARYLLEEAYETVDAIETGDLWLLREELGDVLLQVAFHARVAEELEPSQRWSVDDVAADLVAKLVRRHPHVFGDRAVSGAAEVAANWDVIKTAEKGRSSATDGIPLGQPALALVAALQRRAEKAGLSVPPPVTPADDIGGRLFGLVAEAAAAGVDPEAALRDVGRRYRAAILDAEGQEGEAGEEGAAGEAPAADGEAAAAGWVQ